MSEHEVWNELGNLYLISGAYREAVEAYLRSIELDNEFGKPYASLALTYVRQGEYEKAVELYKKSIALSVDDQEKAVVWNQLGNVYVLLKEYAEAMLAYQIADELEEQCEVNFQAAGLHDTAAAPESIEEPADVFSSDQAAPTGVESFSFDGPPILEIGDDLGEYRDAPRSVTEAPSTETWADANNDWNMELTPALDQNAEVYFPELEDDSLAGWLPIPETESFNNPEQYSISPAPLEDEFEQEDEYVLQQPDSQTLDHVDAPALTNIRKYEYNEQFSLQVELETEAKPVPGFGFARRLNNEKSAAQIEYERKRFDDQNFESREEEINEIKIEISKFKRVVQINPRNAAAWDALGTHYKSAGMYKDAILAYQQAISADPVKGLYHHHLALVFAAEGRNEDAIIAYQKVIEIDPEHSLANAALGGYYRKMGLEELAQKHIGKAMKNIYNSESEYNQACLEAICGNPDQAIELLRIALEEKQTYVNWVMHDPDLDAIREHPSFKQLISDFIK